MLFRKIIHNQPSFSIIMENYYKNIAYDGKLLQITLSILIIPENYYNE